MVHLFCKKQIPGFVLGGYFDMADNSVYLTRVDANFLPQCTRNYGMKIRTLLVSDWRQLQRTFSSGVYNTPERERERRTKGLRVDFHFFTRFFRKPAISPPSLIRGFSKCSKRKIASRIALKPRSIHHLGSHKSAARMRRRT